jgi:hypothetical protein
MSLRVAFTGFRVLVRVRVLGFAFLGEKATERERECLCEETCD